MLLGIIIRQKLKRAGQTEPATVMPKPKEEAPVAKKSRLHVATATAGAHKDPRLERASRNRTLPQSPADPALIQYKPTKLEELKTAQSSSSSSSSSPDVASISKDPIVKAFTDPHTADDSPQLSS